MSEYSSLTKKHFLSACLIAKNESRYLLEWIAFHQVVGFDHFYIYDNDSTDDTKRILSKLHERGICTYTEWPRKIHGDNPQVLAYRDMIQRFGGETTWVAIIDADEFIVPLSGERVDDILRNNFQNAISVLCNWRVFGSSGQKEDDGRLCVERFTKCSQVDYHSNNHVKSICKPEFVELAFIHNHYMKPGDVLLSDGSPMRPVRDQLTKSPVFGMLRINHYYCKSLAEFMLKRSKGLADYALDHPSAIRSMDMFFDADRNEVDDDLANKLLDKIKQKYVVLQQYC
ncbi:glycosyltransferase family 2 protein [Methylobacterium indicum]|uniref:glycosyltransferase family 2 protein n=1 Tax=Methylobacterium indicum TaxID=1775910 RepID=UPI0009E54E4D|nr:glycosyltransferase family 2 protein [Methylobacterium indicum]